VIAEKLMLYDPMRAGLRRTQGGEPRGMRVVTSYACVQL
jgi:hypothetical protein